MAYNRNWDYSDNSNEQTPRKKKSSCKLKSFSQTKNGKPTIIGWNHSKTRGFISFIAQPLTKSNSPYKEDGSNIVIDTTKKSKSYERWIVKYKTVHGEFTTTGFVPVDGELRLRIPSLDMIANPRKNYFGTYKRFKGKRFKSRQ